MLLFPPVIDREGSKGLGASTARLFAEAGARVVVTFGNDAEAADQLIASLPGAGHRASQTNQHSKPHECHSLTNHQRQDVGP